VNQTRKERSLCSSPGALGMVMLFAGTMAHAAALDGRVSQVASYASIPFARVTLDAIPPDGNPEYSIQADTFGFFSLTDILAGSYSLTATHPAYAPSITPITLEDNDSTHVSITLVRVLSETFLTLFFDIGDVQSYARLKDAAIVVQRWPGADTSGPAEQTFNLKASAVGAATLSGLEPGYFIFRITRIGWNPLIVPASGAQYLGQDHLVAAALEPTPADLTVTVRGVRTDRDPPEANQLLPDVQVSIAGVDFGDDTDELTSARTAMSDSDGTFTFKRIPPIPRRLRVTRLGYVPYETVIQPNAVGGYDAVTVNLTLAGQRIIVVLNSIYKDKTVLNGATVTLTGYAESSTAGISRTVTAAPDLDSRPVAVFDQLLPGRYWIRIKHTGQLEGLAEFSGNALMWDGSPGVPGYPPGDTGIAVKFQPVEKSAQLLYSEGLEVTVTLDPVPAVIRGRLMATSETERIDPWMLYDFDPTAMIDPRIFSPVAQQGILIESQLGADLFTDGPLSVSVDSDSDGRFAALLPPGRYGIRVPAMTEYAGHHMIIHPDPDNPATQTRTGWPYTVEWPWPDWEEEHHLGWLQLDSEQEFSVELFTHHQAINITGSVTPADNDPLLNVPIVQKSNGAYVDASIYDLFQYGNGEVTATGPVTRTAQIVEDPYGYPAFLLMSLPAGTYTFTVAHPRYTMQPVQLTIGPWTAPGEPPLSSPTWADPAYFFPGVTHGTSWSMPLQPEYSSPGKIRIDYQAWQQVGVDDHGNDIYDYRTRTLSDWNLRIRVFFSPTFSSLTYHAAATFQGDSEIWAPAGGTVELWVNDGTLPTKWFHSSGVMVGASVPVRDGGPENNMLPANAPAFVNGNYEVEIHAINADFPAQEIAGVTGRMLDNVTSFTTSGDPTNPVTVVSTGDVGVFNVQPPLQWVYVSARKTRLRLEPLPMRFRLDLRLRRGMTVSGILKDDDGQPIEGADVRALQRRSGNPLDTKTSDANGAFVLGNFNIQAVYLEIRASGFIPHRQRILPTTPDQADFNASAITLQPLPSPSVPSGGFTLDRFGLFVPGVLKSGDAGGYDVNNALSGLTATWTVRVTPATVSYSLAGLDDANGTPQTTSVSFQDPVESVWLIDKRWFEAPAVANEVQVENALSAPSPLNAKTIRALFSDITAARRNNADFFVIYSAGKLQDSARNGQQVFSGSIKLSDLPSGKFLPMAVLLTRGGAAVAVDYQVPGGKKVLQGLKFPKWAAGVLEAIGVAATFTPDVDPSKVVPLGRFIPLPTFSSGLDLNPVTGYLTYEYRLGVQLIEGEKAPAAGPLALGPKTLGLGFKGEIGFKVSGETSKVELLASGTVSKNAKEGFDLYTPAFLKGVFTIDSASISGNITKTVEQNLDPNFLDHDRSPDYRYTTKAGAFVKVRLLRDLTPMIEKFPAAGAVLGALGRSGVLVFNGLIDLGVGGGVTRTSSTIFPSPAHFGSMIPGQEPPNWNIMGGGGDAANETVTRFNIQVLAGIGLNVTAASKRVSGSIIAQLGPPKDIVGQKGLKFTLNTTPEWPLITRVEGAFQVNGELGVNLWGVHLSRSFNLHETRIDWRPDPGGTRAITYWYDIVPLDSVETRILPGQSPPATFSGDGDSLPAGTVVDGLENGAGAAGLSDNGLAFLSSENGEMTLRFAVRNGASWNASQEIARAAVILDLAVIRLPGGGYLLIWSELDASEIGNPFPDTTVRYAVADAAGATVSGPTQLGSFPAAAAIELNLVPAGSRILLTLATASSGPMSNLFELHHAFYDPPTGQWDAAPASFGPAAPLASWTPAGIATPGNEPQAVVAAVLEDGTVRTWTYNSVDGWSAPMDLADTAVANAAVTFNPDGVPVAAFDTPDGALQLWTFNSAGSAWQQLGAGIPGAGDGITALALTTVNHGADPYAYLAVWGTGGTETALHYVLVATDGQTLAGPQRGSEIDSGAVTRIQAAPGDQADTAVVFGLRAGGIGGAASAFELVIDTGVQLPAGPTVRDLSPDKTVTEGAFTSLVVQADGVAPVELQWLKDDEPLDGRTASRLDIRNAGALDAGVYRAVLIDRNGMVTSAPITLGIATDLILELNAGWNLVGFPKSFSSPLSDVFNSARTSLIDGFAWVWDAETQRYEVIPLDQPPPAGRGIWIYSPVGGMTVPVAPLSSDAFTPTQSGWNLVSPQSTGTPSTGPRLGPLYGWDGRRYVAVPGADEDTLFILRGYWIYLAP